MVTTYSSPGSRSTAAILALYVKVGACLLAVGADVRRIVVAGDLAEGKVFVDALLGADQLVTLTALLELVAFVVAAALFLRWQVAAHRNLPALGEPEPRAGVTAGVAAWFVPVVNLVRPLQIIGDLWRAGDRGASPPRLLRVWWAAWLVALFAVVAAWTLFGEAADIGERQRIDALRAATTALSAVAAGLAIAVVSRTTSRQEARAVTLDVPRAGPPPGREGGRPSGSGLEIVSEAQARTSNRGRSSTEPS